MRNIVLKRLLQSSSSFTRSPSSRSNPFLLSSRCVSLFLSLILSMYIYVFECLCMDALDELFSFHLMPEMLFFLVLLVDNFYLFIFWFLFNISSGELKLYMFGDSFYDLDDYLWFLDCGCGRVSCI
jgi:hypothetical protein